MTLAILAWDVSLSVGVPQIDNEHRLICGLINDLLKVAEAGHEVQVQVVEQSLITLLEAIRQHFSSEERFLSTAGYPECESHQQLHRGLEEKLEHLLARKGLLVNRELVEFLREWFLEHLQIEDQKYAVFLKSR
jgi:hemerythrin-like metal-binding protein